MNTFLFFIGALFVLAFLGIPLGFAISFISAIFLKYVADVPLWIFMQRFFSGLDSFVLVSIPFFLLAGDLMNRGDVTDRIIRLSNALIGHIRGSMAMVNVLASMLFGGISGSAVADVAGIGNILIPTMLKLGYPKSFTVVVTAVSSTLGQIIPPSIIMIVYAATAGVSVGALFLAGIIPGILIGVGQMVLSYIYARKFDFPVGKAQGFVQIKKAFKDALLALVAPIIIIGGVVSGVFTATESSIVAATYCFIVTVFVYKTIRLREIPNIMLNTAIKSAITLFCIGSASVCGWLIGYLEISAIVSQYITNTISSSYMLILLIIVFFLAIGTFMDAVPAIVIFVPMITKVTNLYNLHPIHMGLIISVTLAFGLVTPPYGLCLLFASSIANIEAQRTFFDLSVFLFVIVLVLLFISFIPQISLFLPSILMPSAIVW